MRIRAQGPVVWELSHQIDFTALGAIAIGDTAETKSDMLGDGVDWVLIDNNDDLAGLENVAGSGLKFSATANASVWDVQLTAEDCPILHVPLADYITDYSSKDHVLVGAKINRNSVDGNGEAIGIAFQNAAGTSHGIGVVAGNGPAGAAEVRIHRQSGASTSSTQFTGGDFLTDDEIYLCRPAISAGYALVGRGTGQGTPGADFSPLDMLEFVGMVNVNSAIQVDDGVWATATDRLSITFTANNADGDAIMFLEQLRFYRQRMPWQDR